MIDIQLSELDLSLEVAGIDDLDVILDEKSTVGIQGPILFGPNPTALDYGQLDLDLLGFPYQGNSAYQIAVSEGFTGTVAEWLASLVGPESPNAAVAQAASAAAALSATSAQNHANAAELSKTQAAASATQAAASATSAANSSAQSLVHRTAAENVAIAVALLEQQTEAHVTDAEQFATASQVSRVAAETARSAAEASETSAATSATSATASAASATNSATLAVNAQTAAGNSAAAALLSESAASSYADDSLSSANASQISQIAATASREEAEIAASAAVLHRNSAEAYANDAGSSASAAAISATEASTGAGDAGASATAAAASAAAALNSANTAISEALAAATSAIDALSSSNSAATYATDSSDSATTAAGHASDASLSASAAATSASDADSSSTAASGYANTASTHATDSENSAIAANASAVSAASSFNDADAAATAAAVSADSASTFADDASTSASSATTQATNAATSAGEASTSETNASASATTAEGHAATASAQATLAAESATDAGGSATAANTSAGQALTSATNAGNSATAANSSAVNAASSYTNTVVSGGNQDFSDGLVGWSWNPERTIPASNYSTGWLSYQASFQGRPNVIQQTTGNYCFVYSNKFWPVQAGRTYRVRSSVWIGAVSPSQTYIGMRVLDSSGAPVTGNGGHIYNVAGGVSLATNQWHDLVSTPFTTTTYAAPGITNIQLLAFLNYGITAGASSALDGIWLEDITESVAANNSATAAANSQSLADTSATNAGNSATAANTSAVNAASSFTNTVLVDGNQDFDNGFTGWYGNGGAVPTATASLGGRTNVVSLAAGLAGQWRSTKRFPVDTSRKYKVSTEVYVGDGSGSSQFYIGFAAFDANGNALSHSPGSYAYSAIIGDAWAANTGWIKRDSLLNGANAPITGEGTGTWSIFPVGTRSIELLVLQNYNNGACVTAVNYLRWEDITETQAALFSANAAALSASNAFTLAGEAGVSAGSALTQATNAGVSAYNAELSATTATTQASNATASAASASSSATIAATVATQSVTMNPRFTNYTSSPAVPNDWYDWINGSSAVRTTGVPAGYGMRLAGPAGSNAGVYQLTPLNSVRPSGYLVIEAEVTLYSGAFTGAGVYYVDAQADANGIHGHYLSFATEPSGSVVQGVGTVGRRYKFSKLVQSSSNTAVTRGILYAMSHWEGHGSIAAANSIEWHSCFFRAATEQEIAAGVALPALSASVSTTQSVVAGLSAQDALARYEVVADTGGGTARLRLVSSTYGTRVLLDADYIKFGDNTTFDNAVDVLVTTTGSVSRIIAWGANFGVSSNLIEWQGPSSVTWGNHSELNCTYARTSAGKIYVDGKKQDSIYTDVSAVVSTNISSLSFVDVVTLTLDKAVTLIDLFRVSAGLEVQLSPRTKSSSTTAAPSGSWEIWELPASGTVGERKVASGSWSSNIIGSGPNADYITDMNMGVTEDNWSDISREWRFKHSGLERFVLRMKKTSSENLIDATIKIRTTIQKYG